MGERIGGGVGAGLVVTAVVERSDRASDIGRARTPPRILRHHARDQLVHGVRDVRPPLAQARRPLEHDLRQDRVEVVAGKRRLAGEALEQHRAEREHVAGGVDLALALGLLRGHVRRRPDQRVGPREQVGRRREPRDPEVEQHRLLGAPVAQQDVRRLDVAVDHAALVGGREALGQARAQLERFAVVEPARAQHLAQRLAVVPIEGQVALAAVGHAVGNVSDDHRVAQLGEHLRLAGEPLVPVDAVAVEDLQRDGATGRAIEAAVDDAHPALASHGLDFETPGNDGSDVHDTSVSHSR